MFLRKVYFMVSGWREPEIDATEAFQVPWRIKAFYAFSFVYNIT